MKPKISKKVLKIIAACDHVTNSIDMANRHGEDPWEAIGLGNASEYEKVTKLDEALEVIKRLIEKCEESKENKENKSDE